MQEVVVVLEKDKLTGQQYLYGVFRDEASAREEYGDEGMGYDVEYVKCKVGPS